MFVDFYDELTAGIPVLSAPDVRVELSFDYFGAAWLLLVLPLALSAVQAPLLALSDRWPRRLSVAVGLVTQAFFLAMASEATGAWAFGLALAGWGAAGGVTNGVSEAALVEAYPDRREQMLTRWAFMGSVGDAVAPAFLVAVHAFGGSWRGALAAAAVMYALHALMVLSTMPDRTSDWSAEDSNDDAREPLVAAFRRGIENPALMWWLGATVLCTLLDEILVAFGSLYLCDALGASPALQASAFTSFAIGSGAGLLITERLLAVVPSRHLIMGASTFCLSAFVTWLLLDSATASVVLLGLVGLGTGPLYPLAQARAYAAHSERPGVVAALETLYAPIDLLAPLIIGLIADRYGLVPALAVLAIQPIALFMLAWRRP